MNTIRKPSNQNWLTVRNMEQAVLFAHELAGQISDGHWENARPSNHWEIWCSCGVRVGEQVGTNFYAARSRYRLDDPALLSVVGARMISYVRIARRFGAEHVEALEGALDLDGAFRGVPSYPGEYWDGVRAKLARYDMEAVKAALADETYGRQQLLADLRQLKAAMQVVAR